MIRSESAAVTRVEIARMGRRGEGIAATGADRIYVPYALPGETVDIDRRDEHATLLSVLSPSPDRVDPLCPHFTVCGGCAVQAWAPEPYADWKRGLLVDALARAGVVAEVGPLIDAHGAGRRRATFHARVDGGVRVGFMRARAHEIVAIDACPILDPALGGALPAARAIVKALASSGKPLDIAAAATEGGLEIDLRGHGPLSEAQHARLCAVARNHDLARLSNHGVIVLEARRPVLTLGKARVEPPPGVFVQATAAGEAVLATRVVAALANQKRIADLFAGIGTFALRLAETADVTACDSDASALAALDRAARSTPGLRPVRIETRDLFRRPLNPEELGVFDAIVLDPPRAGAEAQMHAIAASKVEHIVSVACDADSFARDAGILLARGFVVDRVDPVDQFRYSAHVEIVAAFRRPVAKRKRRLLG